MAKGRRGGVSAPGVPPRTAWVAASTRGASRVGAQATKGPLLNRNRDIPRAAVAFNGPKVYAPPRSVSVRRHEIHAADAHNKPTMTHLASPHPRVLRRVASCVSRNVPPLRAPRAGVGSSSVDGGFYVRVNGGVSPRAVLHRAGAEAVRFPVWAPSAPKRSGAGSNGVYNQTPRRLEFGNVWPACAYSSKCATRGPWFTPLARP